MVYVFAPSAQAYDAIVTRLGADFRPLMDVRAGGGAHLRVVPVEETVVPEAVEGERRPRAERVLSNLDSVLVDGFRPVYLARLREAAAEAHQGFAPLQFDVVPDARLIEALGADGTREFLADLRVDVRAWALTPARRDSALKVDSLGRPQTLAATVAVRMVGGQPVARLTVPVRRPVGAAAAETRTLAFLVTLRPGEAASQKFIPAALSTPDDCAPTACSTILNLRPMLGAVLDGNYLPGRVLFVTSWR